MRSRRAAALVVVCMAALAAGCGTGERPTLGDPIDVGGASGTPTGVPQADEVLSRLEGADAPAYTATYEIVRRLGQAEVEAVVARDGDERSITIGDIRYLPGNDPLTCRLSDGSCEDGIDDALTSAYAIGSSFYSTSAARRLRVALTRRASEPVGAVDTIGGSPSACVTVPLGPGDETYCAADSGPLARLDTADLSIELTSLSSSVDPTLFDPGA